MMNKCITYLADCEPFRELLLSFILFSISSIASRPDTFRTAWNVGPSRCEISFTLEVSENAQSQVSVADCVVLYMYSCMFALTVRIPSNAATNH